jgi:hypothetical protein
MFPSSGCSCNSMHSTVKRIFHFSYFNPDYLTSGLTVTRLARAYYICVVSAVLWLCDWSVSQRSSVHVPKVAVASFCAYSGC